MAFIRLLFRHYSDRTMEGHENLRIICVPFEIRTSKQSSDVDGVSPCCVINDGFIFGLLFNPKIEAMCTSKMSDYFLRSTLRDTPENGTLEIINY